jgi:hypothetical protein
MWASVAGDVRLRLGRDPLENTARLVEWYRHNYLVALVARDLRQARRAQPENRQPQQSAPRY